MSSKFPRSLLNVCSKTKKTQLIFCYWDPRHIPTSAFVNSSKVLETDPDYQPELKRNAVTRSFFARCAKSEVKIDEKSLFEVAAKYQHKDK